MSEALGTDCDDPVDFYDDATTSLREGNDGDGNCYDSGNDDKMPGDAQDKGRTL